MPRDSKKRGRRGEAEKRKLDDAAAHEHAGEEHPSQKRRKTLDAGHSDQSQAELSLDQNTDNPEHAEQQYGDDSSFYGLLDEQEQEYFKRADGMLELNQFENPQERSLFLENVYKEADGKELKLACSQSCSRLLERLILLSEPQQLRSLFAKLAGHFLNLIQHRFASHCCETLFIQSAPVVTQELLSPSIEEPERNQTGDQTPSMEKLFLAAVDELSGNLGYLMAEKHASNAIRVLLVVLSGQKLDINSASSVFKSKSKEHVDVARPKKAGDLALEARTVPQSFTSALEKMIKESIAGLDAHYLRTLATHPVGNPMLQLLVQLELTNFGKERAKNTASVIRTLLPDDPIVEGTDSASFINGLIYDPVGSRLLETIVENAPGKMFKSMFKELFKERMASLARNEIAGYVIAKILERLGPDDLEIAVHSILPLIPSLGERGRFAIIRTLIERCEARGISTEPLAEALTKAFSDDDGETFSIPKLLSLPLDLDLPEQSSLSKSPAANSTTNGRERHSKTANPDPAQTSRSSTSISYKNITHASLLAQAMLRTPGPLSTTAFTALSALPPPLCIHIAMTSNLSPILQISLTVPHAPLIFRRKLITRFYSHIGALSLDNSGSHLVDAIWKGTRGMAFARERVAEELAENEADLRHSPCGRKVWRNWQMDLYRRRRGEWVQMMRDIVGNEEFVSFPGGDGAARHAQPNRAAATNGNAGVGANANGGNRTPTALAPQQNRTSGNGPSTGANAGAGGKSKLDLARERHAKQRKLSPPVPKAASGPNASAVSRNGR